MDGGEQVSQALRRPPLALRYQMLLGLEAGRLPGSGANRKAVSLRAGISEVIAVDLEVIDFAIDDRIGGQQYLGHKMTSVCTHWSVWFSFCVELLLQ